MLSALILKIYEGGHDESLPVQALCQAVGIEKGKACALPELWTRCVGGVPEKNATVLDHRIAAKIEVAGNRDLASRFDLLQQGTGDRHELDHFFLPGIQASFLPSCHIAHADAPKEADLTTFGAWEPSGWKQSCHLARSFVGLPQHVVGKLAPIRSGCPEGAVFIFRASALEPETCTQGGEIGRAHV